MDNISQSIQFEHAIINLHASNDWKCSIVMRKFRMQIKYYMQKRGFINYGPDYSNVVG